MSKGFLTRSLLLISMLATLLFPAVDASNSRSITVLATAYNSLPNQTDSTPHVTATGTRTRFGIIAISRDLLKNIPYGSRVKLQDLGDYATGRGYGRYNDLLRDQVFIVEDTMHRRKTGQIDVWMSSRSASLNWGRRRVNITVL